MRWRVAACLARALSLFAAGPRGALADDYAKTPGSNLVVKGGSPNMYRIADYMTKAFNLERAIEDNETGLGVALLGSRFCIGDHPSLAERKKRITSKPSRS